MIRACLVDKALAVSRDGDDARLGAINEMREHTRAAVLAWHFGDGYPGGRIGDAVVDRSTGRLGHSQAITGIAGRRRRHMLGAQGNVGE